MTEIFLGIVVFFLFFSLLGNMMQYLRNQNDSNKYKDHQNVNVLSESGFDWNVKTGPIIANALDFECPPEPTCPPCDKEECPPCPKSQTVSIHSSGGVMSSEELHTFKQLLLFINQARLGRNCSNATTQEVWSKCLDKIQSSYHSLLPKSLEQYKKELRPKFERLIQKYDLPIK